MLKMALRGFVFLALLSLLPAGHSLAAEPFPMSADEVSPGVYAVITPSRALPNPQNRGWNSNSAFVVTEGGVLLFDTGSSIAIGHALKQTIASVTDQPVRWIVNSHAHGDHWLGNAVFKDTVEAIYSTGKVTRTVASEGQTWIELFDRMTGGITGSGEIVPPDTALDERTELTLGGKRLVLFPSGDSHSPGDVVLWLPDDRVLISGDVVYSDRMPSTNNSNLARWIELLDELRALDPKVVIPGHGSITDVAGLERLRSLLQAFWDAVANGVDEGMAAYELVDTVGVALAPYEADFPGLREKLKRDISHVYLQVEAAAF
ncbi:MAG: MBL fold metallo-hydrolase [Gammaproteobacteria bacterium]